MLTNEQIEEAKKQIISQIDSNFPGDKKEIAKQQVQEMTNAEFEEFLKQNNMLHGNEENQQCIFCSIVKGDIKSYKIDESEDAIAILEINPISKGHTIIIPKKHIVSEQIGESIIEFGKKVSDILQNKLNPKKVSVFSTTLMNHSIINLLPIYQAEDKDSERKQANPKELEELQKILTEEKTIKKKEEPKKKEIIKKPKAKKLKDIKLPKRIP